MSLCNFFKIQYYNSNEITEKIATDEMIFES